MAETGQNNSEGSGQTQGQQGNQQPEQTTQSPPAETSEETVEGGQEEEIEEEPSMEQQTEPPQFEEAYPVDSSEPSSPPHEDSFSSGGEQTSLLDDGTTFMAPGGLMPVMLEQGGFQIPMMSMVMQSKGLPSDGNQPPSDELPSPPPQGDDLKRLVLHQVEYYFSKENLSSDKYLLSQMDGDHYVPISIIANFNQVKRLTVDTDLIIDAIRESTLLQLDEGDDKVRAVPEKRCILILREIPKETPKREITLLFSNAICPKFVSCEFAENDCWYVSFESEEDAQKAFTYLREEVREFLGQPIRARIKGTTVQRPSTGPKKPRFSYPMQASASYNGQPPVQYYQQPGMVPAWPPYYDPNYFVNGYPPQQGFNGPPNRFTNSHHPMGGGRGGPGGRGRPQRGHSPIPPGNVENLIGTGNGRNSRGGEHFPSSGRYRRDNEDHRNRSIPRLRRHRGGEPEKNPPPRQQMKQQQKLDLAPAHFPPLPTSDNGITPPTPTLPTPNHTEETNLADIVKGKRLKENSLSNGNSSTSGGPTGNPSEKHTPKMNSVSGTVKAQAPPQPANGQSSSSPLTQQPSQPKPQPQRPDSKALLKSPNSKNNSSRLGDRDNARQNNNSRNTQVSRADSKPAPPTKGRYRDRDRERDKRGVGSNPRSQQPRPSPKPQKKPTVVPPPPPTTPTPTSDKTATKPENGTKSERLSYAQMAQKAKAAPQPQTTKTSIPNALSSGSSSVNGATATQPKQAHQTMASSKDQPSNSSSSNNNDVNAAASSPPPPPSSSSSHPSQQPSSPTNSG